MGSRSRHLTQNRNVQIFQIRVPAQIDPDFRLSPIRVTIGAIANSRARRIADMLAGLAGIEFDRLGAQGVSANPVETSRDIKEKLTMILPMLLGLNALDGCPLSDAVREPATEAVFDALAQVGSDRANRRGVFANDAIRFEAPFIRALRDENSARSLVGMPLQEPPQRDTIQEQLDRITAQQDALMARLAPAPAKAPPPLFSIAVDAALDSRRETHGANDPELGAIRHRRDVFIALCGDRLVDSYTRTELQAFVNALAWLPPNFSKKEGFAAQDVVAIVEANREAKHPGLSENSIKTYLNRVKGIIRQACSDAEGTARCEGPIKIPVRAAPPKGRTAPAHDEVGKLVAAGVASGLLSDAMLVPLGLLTGRRIGLLAHMRRENIKRYNGAWVCYPQSHEWRDGAWTPVPFKTSESLTLYVLHEIFEQCGFIEWARREPGPVFAALMAARDPADAAQKRMGRLYAAAKVDRQSGGTFHALRSGKIRNDRELRLDPRAVRLQVGHELSDVHEKYDGQLTDAELISLSTAPLPPGIDWSILRSIDFESFASRRPHGGRKKTMS